MLAATIVIISLQISLTKSSKIIMVTRKKTIILATWIIRSWRPLLFLRKTLKWSRALGLESEGTLLTIHWGQAYLKNKEKKLRPRYHRHSLPLKVIWLANTMHWHHSRNKKESSWLKIISCLKKAIASLKHVVSIETGLMAEVYSIIMKRLSLSGLTRRTNWESSLCNKELILVQFLLDSLKPVPILRKWLNFSMMSILAILHPVLQILVLLWELQFISIYLIWAWSMIYSNQSQTNSMFRSEGPMASTQRLMTISMISQTSEDWADLR